MYKGNAKHGEIEIINENLVFKNKFICLYNDDVLFPNGGVGKYFRIKNNYSNYGVVIVPVTESGKIVLLTEFHHARREWIYTIPKGYGESDLTYHECAKAELLQEAGMIPKVLSKVLSYPENGAKVQVFVATGCEFVGQQLEETECISNVGQYDVHEIKEMIDTGVINEQATLIGLLYYLNLNKR
ncbi:NUDIX hydrolase [Photobacterium leiognathi]|uniref:NUDIX hydrolase n=1 Tax=Photobacterium leiognathi TaxID=553611 RepID=UPI0029812B3F|nr:NUDIX hydrolase [Photobacterium leiognathi]